MATMVYRDGDALRTIPGINPGFIVKDFSDGIAEIEPLANCDIENVLDMVMGCYRLCSNFVQELRKFYGTNVNATFKGIRFTHEGVSVFCAPNTLDKFEILAQYWKNRYLNKVRLDDYISTGDPYRSRR